MVGLLTVEGAGAEGGRCVSGVRLAEMRAGAALVCGGRG